ncbi:GCG_CRPN prefix-to-repeats domain-containing protein [Neorhizobium petrolearium]|uniref:GCG_CRPN prefix-to-repeats domain-containing protein n=1 Tax=Neorhizobium petrolearium TaxID=515361 RepID=UPI003F7DF322
MRIIIITAVMIAGSLIGTATNAMPIGHVKAPTASPVVSVDWACGRGYHLNRWGECRPNRWRSPPRRHYGWDRPRGWHHGHHPRRHWREHSWRERHWRDWR